MGGIVLLGLGLLLLATSKGGGAAGQVSAQHFAQVKAAINSAVEQDIGRGAGTATPPLGPLRDGWLNQLAMAWIRGNAVEIAGIAGAMQLTHPFTSQAFGSRYQQITGRPYIAAPAAAAAPKAA